MFRVLTHRRKSRLTSPRFVIGSVAAHVVAALVVVSVSRAGPLPTPPEDPEIIRYIPVDPPAPEDPSPPPVEPVRPVRQGDFKELIPPETVPDRIPDPDPTEPAVDPDDYSAIGIPADSVVPNPGPPPPSQPPGDGPRGGPDYRGMPFPESYVDVKPSLANSAEAGRLLQRHYPAIYADAGVPGLTVVEVVVEANGRVRRGSARVVQTSHEQFGEAALRIVERFRFSPGKVGEQPVAVSVQVPIHWQPAN